MNPPPSSPSGSSRSAAWALGGALGGVVIGCALPVFACLLLVVVGISGLSATAGTAASAAPLDSISAVYVSGPRTGPAVAVIDVAGQITAGDAENPILGATGVASSGPIVRAIQAAARNPDVKVILLRIDSPGGSVIGSDEIYHALRKSGKPVVAQMRSLAASGGYYVAMGADHIVAHPDTLTGSIGVISEFTNYEGLYEKLGIRSRIVKSGENKDFGAPTVPFTAADERLWQAVIDEAYDNFVRIIAERRALPLDKVRELADGRVYTGRQAAALKLIDSLGYYEDALTEAAARGGIEGEPRVLQFRPRSTWSELLSSSMARALQQSLGLPAQRAAGLEYR
jgi:protease-4